MTSTKTRKRKEHNACLDEFQSELTKLVEKYEFFSVVCAVATAVKTDEGKPTLGMSVVRVGAGALHESLCAFAFGYSSGHHVRHMDDMKSVGTDLYRRSNP